MHAQSLTAFGANSASRGKIAFSRGPGSTQVLDRGTMQLVQCTPALCRGASDSNVLERANGGASTSTSGAGGGGKAAPASSNTSLPQQPINLVTTRYSSPSFLCMTPSSSPALQQSVYDMISLVGASTPGH